MNMQPIAVDQSPRQIAPKRHALDNISLLNFRHATQYYLETEGQPVLLSGHNGAGKTNILEAVSLLSPGRGVRQASAEQFLHRHAAPEVGWQIAARLHDEQQDEGFLVKTHWQLGQTSRKVSLEDARISQQTLGEYCRTISFGPRDDQLFLAGSEAIRRFFDRLVSVFDPAHSNRVQSLRQLQRQRRQLMYAEIQDMAWRRALEKQLAAKMVVVSASRAQHARALARVCRERVPDFVVRSANDQAAWLVTLQGGIQARLREHSALAVEEEIAELLHAERWGSGESDIQDIWQVHLQSRGWQGTEELIPVAELSHGQQKLAVLAMVLAQAWLMHEDLALLPMVLLDEGLSHLDQYHRDVLFTHLRDLRCQFWLTGIDIARYHERFPAAKSVMLSSLKE